MQFIILFMTAGHMWVQIRHPAYVQPQRNGKVEYIAGGYQTQLGAEVHIVSAICPFLFLLLSSSDSPTHARRFTPNRTDGILGFSAYTLAYTIPKLNDPVRQRLGVYVWTGVFVVMAGVLMNIFGTMKQPGCAFLLSSLLSSASCTDSDDAQTPSASSKWEGNSRRLRVEWKKRSARRFGKVRSLAALLLVRSAFPATFEPSRGATVRNERMKWNCDRPEVPRLRDDSERVVSDFLPLVYLLIPTHQSIYEQPPPSARPLPSRSLSSCIDRSPPPPRQSLNLAPTSTLRSSNDCSNSQSLVSGQRPSSIAHRSRGRASKQSGPQLSTWVAGNKGSLRKEAERAQR